MQRLTDQCVPMATSTEAQNRQSHRTNSPCTNDHRYTTDGGKTHTEEEASLPRPHAAYRLRSQTTSRLSREPGRDTTRVRVEEKARSLNLTVNTSVLHAFLTQ